MLLTVRDLTLKLYDLIFPLFSSFPFSSSGLGLPVQEHPVPADPAREESFQLIKLVVLRSPASVLTVAPGGEGGKSCWPEEMWWCVVIFVQKWP